MSRGLVALVVLVACTAAAAPLEAQNPPDTRERVRRGLESYARGIAATGQAREDALHAALAEFAEAYRVDPFPLLLFNLGQVYSALDRPVDADDVLTRFLDAPGAGTASSRIGAARALAATVRQRIGRIRLDLDVPGASVIVDEEPRGETPLAEGLRVAAGRHTVVVRAAGHVEWRQSVEVASEQEVRVPVALVREATTQGILDVTGLAGVAITVDGRPVGTTPVRGVAVPPGPHRIEGRRAGYLPASTTVDVAVGATLPVHLRPEIDPDAEPDDLGRVRLRLPPVPARVRVDAREASLAGGVLTLPVGHHDLVVEATERDPFSTAVEVVAGQQVELTPQLSWASDARAERVASAGTRRRWGYVTAIGGGVLAGGAIATWIVREVVLAGQLDDLHAERAACGTAATCPSGRTAADVDADISDAEIRRAPYLPLAIGATIAALAAGVASVILFTSAESDAEIDGQAHAARGHVELRVGLGSLVVDGTM